MVQEGIPKGGAASRLDAAYREAAWARLEQDAFDVVVIGGGVTGAGTALDAATRGLSVALIEARDWAAGTSSRSSKLFHGGLRYLEQLEFGLVREALRERELMLTRLAPHLVKPVPFLYPLTHRLWERPYVAAGLLMYDSIGGHSSLPAQKQLSRRAALRMFPGLRDDVAGRRGALLRRAGRRRAAHPHRRAHRGPLRGGGADLHAGRRLRP